MPALKISYFDIQGRAEPLRLACVVGDLEFTDERYPKSHFPEIRPKTPYGSVPIMEIEGQTAAQSIAMLRYLGKVTNLYPECPKMALIVDEAIDVIGDLEGCIYRYQGDDKDKLREDRAKFTEVDVPRYLGALEKRLQGMYDGPWLVGGVMTIADLAMVTAVNVFKSDSLEFVCKNTLDAYPRIMQSYNACMKHPKIAEWYKKHPIPNVTA